MRYATSPTRATLPEFSTINFEVVGARRVKTKDTYIHTYIHTHIHTNKQTNKQTNKHTYIHT